MSTSGEPAADGIAIIGMAGRFPGAKSVAEFWKNLTNGVESISRFAVDELETDGGASQAPNFVAARSVLDDADQFDASYFGIFPKEAELSFWTDVKNALDDKEQFNTLAKKLGGSSTTPLYEAARLRLAATR